MMCFLPVSRSKHSGDALDTAFLPSGGWMDGWQRDLCVVYVCVCVWIDSVASCRCRPYAERETDRGRERDVSIFLHSHRVLCA
mmetsp:Transcript_22147/g.63144  ORF Transcript_22147/g.63144 Transcript_22147/m.63144 type:complete len:83 (+) Transcript_22147:199-447(+)